MIVRNGDWVTDGEWTWREDSYVTCSVCNLPVDKVSSNFGWCAECIEYMDQIGMEE